MPDVTIRIVGTGPDEAALKSLASLLGVTDRIEFLGFQQRKQTLQILADADVFVQPSLFEGHSLALIEAMRLGLPVVVSNVPSQVDAITHPTLGPCGLAVPPDDPGALAAAILSLLDDPKSYADYAERSAKRGTAHSFSATLGAYLALVGYQSSPTDD